MGAFPTLLFEYFQLPLVVNELYDPAYGFTELPIARLGDKFPVMVRLDDEFTISLTGLVMTPINAVRAGQVQVTPPQVRRSVRVPRVRLRLA